MLEDPEGPNAHHAPSAGQERDFTRIGTMAKKKSDEGTKRETKVTRRRFLPKALRVKKKRGPKDKKVK